MAAGRSVTFKFRSPSGKEHEAAYADALSAVRQQYYLMKARQTCPSNVTLAEQIRRLKAAIGTAAEILDRDLGGQCQIEIALRSAGADAVRAAETLHALEDAAEQVLFSLDSAYVYDGPTVRGESAETWLFVELYGLYVKETGRKNIGVGGPLYRFIRNAVPLVDKDVVIPEPEAFRKRLGAALKRRDLEKSLNNKSAFFQL